MLFVCVSDEEGGSKSASLIKIVLPIVMTVFAAILITIATITIVLWKRRMQGEKKSHDSPDHGDITTDNVSLVTLQSEIEQSETTTNVASYHLT